MSASIRSKWGRNKEKVADGVWINCDEIDTDEAFMLKVRYLKISSNPDYAKCITRLTKPYRRHGELSYELQASIAMRAFCKVILVDWKNAFDDEGNVIPFNEQNAIDLMEDFPDLYEFISTEAADPNNFDQPSMEDDEGTAKNSKSTSSTSWSTEVPVPPSEDN